MSHLIHTVIRSQPDKNHMLKLDVKGELSLKKLYRLFTRCSHLCEKEQEEWGGVDL